MSDSLLSATTWAPRTLGEFPRFLTLITLKKVLFLVSSTFFQQPTPVTSIGQHRTLNFFLAGKGRTMPILPTSQQPRMAEQARYFQQRQSTPNPGADWLFVAKSARTIRWQCNVARNTPSKEYCIKVLCCTAQDCDFLVSTCTGNEQKQGMSVKIGSGCYLRY